jgi:hypothetical protein
MTVGMCQDCGAITDSSTPLARFCVSCSNDRHGYTTRAITAVWKAVREGLLPNPKTLQCVDCDRPAQCYDHRDYNRPLNVWPVCRKCNYRRGSAIDPHIDSRQHERLVHRRMGSWRPREQFQFVERT